MASTGDCVNPKEPVIFASALSKCVFKKGRLTIPPDVILTNSGVLPPKPLKRAEAESARTSSQSDFAVDEVPLNSVGVEEPQDRTKPSEQPDSKDPFINDGVESNSGEWTYDMVEVERERGMRSADLLAGQAALEHEFTAEGEVLGRHSDGTGAVGVVSTLCQLARIHNTQSL